LHRGDKKSCKKRRGYFVALTETPMTKEILDRRAADNEYLHPDFHGAFSAGLQYLDDNYGADAVRRYLREFTLSYYAPLMAEIKNRGLVALRDHFEKIYRDEGAEVEISGDENELLIRVAACPAVMHIQNNNYLLANLFGESTRVVNETLCEGTPFFAELLDYDPQTGAGTQLFARKTVAEKNCDSL
jgi:hypothetical protein